MRFNSKLKTQNSKLQRGFTLTELLIYMGTLAIFLIVLTRIFSVILETRLNTEATSGVEQDSKFITARILYDMQRSSAVTIPNALGGSGGVLSLTIGGVEYRYEIQGSDLVLTEGAGAPIRLNSVGSTITALNFLRLGNSGGKNTVRITMTVRSTKQVRGIYETDTVNTTLGTQN